MMKFTCRKFLGRMPLLTGLILLGWTQAGVAQVDPTAAKAVKQMSDTLASAQNFSFSGTRTLDSALVPISGTKPAQFLTKVQVNVSRPDKFFIKATGVEDTRQFYFDGNEFTLFDARSRAYGKVLTKQVNIDQMLGHLQTKWGFMPPVSDFIMGDSYKMLMDDVLTGRVVTEVKASKQVQHLAFTQQTVDWDLWISEKTHLPVKLVIVFKTKPGHPKFQFDFEVWNLQAKFSPQTFTFLPPPGVTEKELTPLVKATVKK